MSAGASTPKQRRVPGIKRPDPVKLEALRKTLAAEPGITKAALARRVGLGRSTLPLYMRFIRDDLARAAERNDAAREQIATTHVDLIARMNATAREVREDIAELRAAGAGTNAAVVFAGVRTLVQVERLIGELVGVVRPPTVNTYVLQVRALMEQAVAPASLSETTRCALGVGPDASPE